MFEQDHMMKTEIALAIIFMLGFLLGVAFRGG